MSSCERIIAALNHKEVDRTPIFEYVLLSPIADKLLGRLYAGDPDNWPDMLREKGFEGAVRQNAIDRLDLAELLGHDMMYVVPNPLPTNANEQVDVPRQPSSDDPVKNVKNRNDKFAQQKHVPPQEAFLIYTFLKEEMQHRGIDLPILAPAYSHGIWTDVDLMQTMLLAPDVARRHFTLATQRSLALIEKYLPLGINQIGVGGDFAGSTLMISPQAYREFIVPEVRTLSRRIHTAGCYAVNASDGNLWPVIDDFLIGCEVDGYLEIDMHAGMDLRKLKKLYGDRVTLYGNLDCGNILSFGSESDIAGHVRKCLLAGMGTGGHIFCASNAVTSSIPLSNYITVIRSYRKFFGLPQLML
ncbi:MAG: uroporphyrinogen decarboxylase family protein [Sedimentisphaerales bacterium]